MLPTLAELLALRAAAARGSLRGLASGRAAPQGARPSSARGRGLEFEEVRAYVAGDDLRRIHWRVTARRGRPHTKLFREERERAVWLLVELDAGMYFGSRGQLKSALAVRAAALLAWAAVAGGDRVGAVIVDSAGGLGCLPPRAREAGVLPVLRELVARQPRAPAVPVAGQSAAALRQLAAVARPGSLVLALSDFAGLDAAAEARWLALAERHDCRLFPISDRLEREGLPDGRYRGGLPGRLHTLDGAALRSRWVGAWEARAACLGTLARRLRAPLITLDTATPAVQALAHVLKPGVRAA
jgi:uncharacterized protein (DUF58 family)